MNILNLIGRESEIFEYDIEYKEAELRNIVEASSFLVIGAAGSIGQAVTKEIFKRNPSKLHVIDLSENSYYNSKSKPLDFKEALKKVEEILN